MLVLDLLSDGKWHEKEELLGLGLNERKFQEITVFLSTYGFVQVDVENGKVKIDGDFKKLLVQTVS
jgi:hypothetical protein